MINTSTEWKEYVQTSSVFNIKGTLTATDGTSLSLTDDDFVLGSVVIGDAVSGTSTFDVGSVITNSFKATLVNDTDKFSDFDFEGARLTLYVGIESLNEYVRKGTFFIDRPTTVGRTIDINGYDKMDQLNTYYIGKTLDAYNNVIDITFPITSQNLVEAIMRWVGWTYEINTFWELGTPLTINEFEYDESTTCRQVLNWIMQLEGGFARINNLNALRCRWYDYSGWIDVDDLDGGLIAGWTTVDTADGGEVDPWDSTDEIVGGYSATWYFDTVSESALDLNDIRITGIRAYEDDTTDEFSFTTVGEDGYILEVRNPLVKVATDGTHIGTKAVANHLYKRVGRMGFRPFHAQIFGDPSIEAGDSCVICDYKGNMYLSLVTQSNFTLGGFQTIGCYAESQSAKGVSYASETTSAIQTAVRAAYDYLQAKKISADYITSGTIEGSIIAKNLTMEGGRINIQTSSETTDEITLQAETTDGLSSVTLSPISLSKQIDGVRRFYLGTSGTTTGGSLILRDPDGNVAATLSAATAGDGTLNLHTGGNLGVNISGYQKSVTTYDNNQHPTAMFGSGTSGGYLTIRNSNNQMAGTLYGGSGNDGTLNLYDGSGNLSHNLSGGGREISVYDSNGTKEVVIGSGNGITYGDISLRNNGVERFNIGYGGGYIYGYNQDGAYSFTLGSGNGAYGINNFFDGTRLRIGINASTGGLTLRNTAGTTTINCLGNTGAITCVSLTQTSKEEAKTRIKKAPNCLDEVMSTDILTYILKADKQTTEEVIDEETGEVIDVIVKKNENPPTRYGVIIDSEKYGCTPLIHNGEGVDTYSMVSVLWKAVQEQQGIINEMKSDIETLKAQIEEIKNGNTN